ncbi:hypothetical protein RUM44_004183 [Polyplax serrata]|uniref:Calcineurin-like phosphoesterase domain-containing protein n=1 Tax=Polyplax serrata TaxID=468196 RepID=A0ABR1B237_POLSC
MSIIENEVEREIILTYKSIFLIGAFLVFFYFEFLAYWVLPLTWLKQPNCQPPYCKKLLLVADPQIVGREWKNQPFIDWVAIFDSDRYIRRTFLKAFNYVQPDIVVFLGDLMDQGWIAPTSEYTIFVDRLKNIFKFPQHQNATKVVLSPGDNDIGGIDEILIPSHMHRFERTFNQTDDSILIESIEFCIANLMTAKLQQSKFIDADIIRIALSHVPLIPKQNYFLNEVIKKIKPHLILSGHLHKSYHYLTYENNLWRSEKNNIFPTDSQIHYYKFHDGLIHEIIVPTCSYRMGVNNMGYGAAYIGESHLLVTCL